MRVRGSGLRFHVEGSVKFQVEGSRFRLRVQGSG